MTNVKRFKFISSYLFATDSNGKSKLISISNGEIGNTICEFDFGNDYSSYNVLALDEASCEGVLGNLQGEVIRFKINKKSKQIEVICKKKLVDYQLMNLFLVENELICCGPNGQITIVCNLEESDSKQFDLPAVKDQQLNCVLKLSEFLIAFGDRAGNIIIYKKSNQNEHISKAYSLVKLFKKVHCNVGVKQLTKNPLFKNQFYSCGRDGRIVEYSFEDSKKGEGVLKIDLLRLIKSPIEIDYIARIEFDELDGGLKYIIGFKMNMFIIWDNRTQSIAWTVNGCISNRLWDFKRTSTRLNFAYLKNDKLILAFKQLDSSLLIRSKHHTNTVLCARPLFLNEFRNEKKKFYYITGSEDNDLFVNSFNRERQETLIEAQLDGHVSNVRALCIIKKYIQSSECLANDLLCSVGASSQIMIWDLKLNLDGQLIVKQLVNYFIWPPDKESSNKPWIKKPKEQFDTQLRFMDVSLRRQSENSNDFLIFTICSDSTFRLFSYSMSKSFIHLISTYGLSKFCPLTMTCLANLILITSTDGSLRLFKSSFYNLNASVIVNLKSNLLDTVPLITIVNDSDENLALREADQHFELLETLQLHQFGINSIDYLEIGADRYLILTSGEDTALGYCLISFNENKNLKLEFSGSCLMKHCSMISKIKILDSDLLMTVSWDKRIKIWQFKLNEKERRLELKWLQTIITSLPDISDVILDRAGDTPNDFNLIVLGKGIEIYQLNNSPSKVVQK